MIQTTRSQTLDFPSIDRMIHGSPRVYVTNKFTENTITPDCFTGLLIVLCAIHASKL